MDINNNHSKLSRSQLLFGLLMYGLPPPPPPESVILPAINITWRLTSMAGTDKIHRELRPPVANSTTKSIATAFYKWWTSQQIQYPTVQHVRHSYETRLGICGIIPLGSAFKRDGVKFRNEYHNTAFNWFDFHC